MLELIYVAVLIVCIGLNSMIVVSQIKRLSDKIDASKLEGDK